MPPRSCHSAPRRGAVLLALLGVCATAAPEPTDITVRVLSRDAKFVGTSMGGVSITLADAITGEQLARGTTSGDTGDTQLIMHEGGGRRAHLVDATTAGYTVTLDLERPRLVRVDAYGPLGQPQAAHRVSSTQWVVPGKHLSGGNGWVLEMPGFVVDVLAPPAHVRLKDTPDGVPLRANVTLMCGCPIEPGGLWDANRYEVRALVEKDDAPLGEFPLRYAGATSQFETTLLLDGPGTYVVTVYAHDPHNGNTGLDRTTFFLR